MKNFAIQLYSVRDHFLNDPQTTYVALKNAGYDHVELFAVTPDAAPQHRTWLDDAGLCAVCAHFDYETVTQNPEAVGQAAKDLGCAYVVMPWVVFDTMDAWVVAAQRLDAAGAQLRASGIRLGYHNHDHEFRPIDGELPFDAILKHSSPENVFIELDTYWAEEAGEDGPERMRSLAGRCPLLHLKDRPKDGPIPFTEIGSGSTDWPRLMEAAHRVGVEWFIVEQDESTKDTLESAAISAAFMRTLA